MFRNARLKLTLAYTLGIAVIMAIFSVELYIALAGNIDIPGNAPERADAAIQASQLAHIRLVLAVVNVAGWVLAAVASYITAGRTLRPIENAVERQRRFTAHASHELRTPLTVIKGHVDVTLARERPVSYYQRTLHAIDREAAHLETLVGDLLDLAQLEGRQTLPEREPRQVQEAIDDAVTPYLSRLNEKRLTLITEVPPGLQASLDWGRIRHLIGNLLDNAIRHAPVGGEVQIAATERGDDMEISVSNTGTSIAEGDLPHLFLPFYRGRDSDPEHGTGLGLALCDWIARAHGGSIAARNNAGGPAFVVRLPRGIRTV